MQILSARPLIQKFQDNSFDDSSIGPYFVGYIVLSGIAMSLPYFGDANEWDIATTILTSLGSIFGVFYLKNKNGGTFGSSYLNKYFALGWIMAVRMIIIGVPTSLMFMSTVIVMFGKSKDDIGAGSFVYSLLWLVAFFYWLGRLFDESIKKPREQAAPSNR
jgi:hypothetical protein